MPPKSSAKRRKVKRQVLKELDVKISFLEGLTRRDPAYVDALQLLGDHYSQRGRVEQGLKIDQQLAQLDPGNPLVYYNLACSYSLNEDFDAAAVALDKAISLGYRDFNWLAKDPDLRRLRKHPIFRGLRDKIRQLQVDVD